MLVKGALGISHLEWMYAACFVSYSVHIDTLLHATLSLVYTKLVCNTSLHVPTQITEWVKTGNFAEMFCIIRYQYVSKQFSVRRSGLYSVRSPLVSSSDRVSHQFNSWGRRFQTVQVRLQCVGTRSDPVVPRSHCTPNSVLTSS